MIEEIKRLRWKSKEQLELYEKRKGDLSYSDKFGLINNLINEDFFSYLELIAKISYDLAEVSDEYIKLLEKISDKIKNDMAQWPFLNALKEIGKEKQDIALQIYKKIMSQSKDEYLKTVSGLILGGYSINHEEEFKEMIKKSEEDLTIISYIKSIIVIYEKEKELNEEIYHFLDKVESSEKENLLRELANLSLVLFDKNSDYFYKKILSLVNLKNKEINYLIFSRLSYTKTIPKEKRFELIELVKDSEEIILDEILKVLRDYPEEKEVIGNLVIYWINKNIDYKLRNLDWVLEDLSKRNEKFINYFLDNFNKIKKPIGRHSVPGLFLVMSKNNISYSVEFLSKFKISNKEEAKLFYELCGKIVSNIYSNEKHYSDLAKLISKLQEIARKRNFISKNLLKEIGEKPSIEEELKKKYDTLINLVYELIEQLEYRQDSYNFEQIDQSLKKYTELHKYTKEVISRCEKEKRFSYLLWLGEREEPLEEKIEIKEEDDPLTKSFKHQFILGKYWPRAYLTRLEEIVDLYKKYPNGKLDSLKLEEEIKKNLMNENRFWTFFSELLLIGKLDKTNSITEIEPKIESIPSKKENYLDLKINLFDRDIYFEVTRPEVDRSLKLASGAVALGNKSFSVINKKYQKQLKNLYDAIKKKKKKSSIFVVIEIGNSTVDEYGILSAFSGSPAYTLITDKKTGRVIKDYPTLAEDSLHNTNSKTEIISGVIYFKQELFFEGDSPKIKLVGDIIQNPKAINKLSEEEIKKLKEIVFG